MVTLQCDPSDTGLGAALLQLQQPASFALRALTQTEMIFAQIEKDNRHCVRLREI